MHYYKTVISEVGPEVRDLLEGGVLILYADGAPPELAEVSVLHRAEQAHAEAPRAGSQLRIGEVSAVGHRGRADGVEQGERDGPRGDQFQRFEHG